MKLRRIAWVLAPAALLAPSEALLASFWCIIIIIIISSSSSSMSITINITVTIIITIIIDTAFD